MKKIIKNPMFLITLIIVLVVSAVIKDSLTNQVYAVTLKVDGETKQVESNSEDVETLMIENNIDVSAHDKINVDKEEPLKDGMVIEVERAKQVTILRGDERISLFTHAEDVKGAIEEAGIKPEEYVLTFPEVDEAITDGELIKLFDEVEEKPEVKTHEVSIAPETVYIEDSNLEQGLEEVRQDGTPGTLRFDFYPGDENFDLSQGEMIKEPVERIVAQGTYVEPVVESTPASSSSSYSNEETSTSSYSAPSSAPSGTTMIFEATAYNLIGTTASGIPSGPGYVAVDPNVIPLGTRLYIESTDGWPDYGYAIAADTGSAIKGHIIDLFYYDYDTCIQFGRRNIKVTILD